MSLRPSFAAFSLDKLKSLFGSKDMAAKQFAIECYAEVSYDDREIKQAEKILRKIVGWNEAAQMFGPMHLSPVG